MQKQISNGKIFLGLILITCLLLARSGFTADAGNVTGVDFLANENGGTIVIQTTGEVTYTTRKNDANKQFVLEVQPVQLPAKFQRPYSTKDFKGAVGGFQAYQAAGSSVARFVVQLKNDNEPVVQQEGGRLMIVASGVGSPSATAENNATIGEENKAPAPAMEKPAGKLQASVSNEPANETMAEPSAENRVLAAKTLEDYLTGNTKFYGKKISLQVQDGDVRDVFNFIAEQSGLNLVLTDEVKGNITLKLRQIPWDQALVIVMQAKQLGYVRQGNILRIAPLSTLKSESESAKQVADSQRLLQPLRVRIFNISYAKASDLLNQSKDFLSTRGKISSDDRTNSLVVTDIDENLKKVERLLKSLDTQTPQVLIEAKVVEARETGSRDIGINWNFNGASTKIGQSGLGDIGIVPTAAVNLASSTATGTSQFGVRVGKFDLIGDLTATLGLLETENKVKVISSPRIVTLNNIKAKIEQTTEFPITTTTATSSGTVSNTTYKAVKLELEVTPQITAEGAVIMQMKVLREFPGTPDTVGGPRPVNSRAANTTVLIANGDTAVIGGIYQSDVTNGETRVPFLSKIPILGWFFKNETATKEKNELLIFLTPRVLNGEKAFTHNTAIE